MGLRRLSQLYPGCLKTGQKQPLSRHYSWEARRRTIRNRSRNGCATESRSAQALLCKVPPHPLQSVITTSFTLFTNSSANGPPHKTYIPPCHPNPLSESSLLFSAALASGRKCKGCSDNTVLRMSSDGTRFLRAGMGKPKDWPRCS